MSGENCRNDCTTPLRFPQRPGADPASAHGDGCTCCGTAERIGQGNRPGLSHFNYRLGSYGTIREFLLHRVDRTPELRQWTHRTPDDPAIALLEGAAILGDILTFYQDTYANEAFLRTAKWRESVADLVRLLGYRLSPAVGGNAVFAFEIKGNEPVTVPAGFPVKATLEEIAKPAEFETTQEIVAYPWLNRFNLFRPLTTPEFSTEFVIKLPPAHDLSVELKAGDRLLIGEFDNLTPGQPRMLDKGEIVIVDSIRELHGEKIFKVKGGMLSRQGSKYVFAYRLGRTFHHFGYNTPPQITNPSEPVRTVVVTENGKSTATSTINFLQVPLTRAVNDGVTSNTVIPELKENEFPIDSEVKDLANNVPIIVQARFFDPDDKENAETLTIVRTIKKTGPVTMTWGGVSGAVSLIGFSSGLFDPDDAFTKLLSEYADLPKDGETIKADDKKKVMAITDALFHEATSPLLQIAAAPVETGVSSGKQLYFLGTAAEVKTLNGRRIMLEKNGLEPKIVSVTQVPSSFGSDAEKYPELHAITLSETVGYADYPNSGPVVTVFGNLADADEGKTVPETAIGDGDENQIFQNFKLPKAPLTYHLTPENTPVETPEAEVYVNGRLWTKVDSFFGRAPGEQIYIIREDNDGNSWVQFGDGKTGSRLPRGSRNVTARFRIGDGAYGPLKPDTKVQASAKLKNLDKIQMPMDATGGSQAEETENARAAAPGKVQSLGRIVGLSDFEFEAVAIPGVALASAAWELVENIPTVVITVLMETGRGGEIDSVRGALNAYNSSRGAGRYPVRVIAGKRMYVGANVEYALKSTYRADVVEPAVRTALGVNYGKATRDEDQSGLFSLKHRRFGSAEYASSVSGWVQNVEGVLWARTVGFEQLGDAADPAGIALPANPAPGSEITCDASHILSLYDAHLSLQKVTEEGA